MQTTRIFHMAPHPGLAAFPQTLLARENLENHGGQGGEFHGHAALIE
jgi:hypothetical protein